MYCNALKKCISDTETWCGLPSDYMTFNAPATAGVFCSDAERFTIAENYTCPSLSSQMLPEADYTVVHREKTCTSKLGKNESNGDESFLRIVQKLENFKFFYKIFTAVFLRDLCKKISSFTFYLWNVWFVLLKCSFKGSQ